MTGRPSPTRKFVVTLAASAALPFLIYVTAISHSAWGDARYVLQEEYRIKEIAYLDAQLAIKDTEIIFADSDKEKAKLRAIKAIYERQKEALKEKPNK